MRADAKANRDAIVAAARGLFAARGRDIPAQTIASEAGVGIATYYRHFPTMHDLALAVVESVVSDITALEEEHRALLTSDPAAGWWAYMQSMGALRLGALIPMLGPEALEPSILELRLGALDSIGRVVSIAQQAGQVREGIEPIFIQIGIGRITRPLHPMVHDLAPDHEQWMLEVFHRGLMPDRG